MSLETLITGLSSMAGPSGSEDAVAARLAELMAPYTDETRVDAMGNVVGIRRCGKKDAKKLLISAHIDEIGLIVTDISEGFLQFSPIGGVDARMLPARTVDVLTDPPLFGIIGCMPVHALKPEDMEKPVKAEELFIDVGLSDSEAREKVPLGTPVVFHDRCVKLLGDTLCGKAMDDRACAAVMLRALELLDGRELELDVYAMGSVQEELGMRGVTAGAFGAAPDYAVALDVTHAKTPDYKKTGAFDAGCGAVIGVGPNMTRRLSDKLVALAREKDVPYAVEACGGRTGTDAWVIQVSRAGVATALISTPVKYMHTPVETLRLCDAEAAARLLAEFILSAKGGEL